VPDENFNKKPNSAKKGAEKGQANCVKARKKPNFVVLLYFCHKETSKLQENLNKFSSKWRLSFACLVLELITDASLTLHGFWDCTPWGQWCDSLHTDLLAVFCTKVSIHSCTYDQNHKSPSTSSTSCRISVAETQTCLQAVCLLSAYYTLRSAHISRDYAKNISNPASLKSYQRQKAGIGLA